MELTNEFRVGVPVERAWEVLTDVERIAPCMPGAQLQEVEGDEYRGIVKVKVGPITAQYKGAATFASLDAASYTAVLKAEGRETRGQGNASALITAILEPAGDGTRVTVITDLTVTGKVAQFGRGVLADVSAKLLDQFVACLENSVLAPAASATGTTSTSAPPDADEQAALAESADDAVAAAPTPRPEPSGAPMQPEAPAVRVINSPEPVPVDLAKTAGAPVVRRVAGPILGLVALGWLLRVFLRRRKK